MIVNDVDVSETCSAYIERLRLCVPMRREGAAVVYLVLGMRVWDVALQLWLDGRSNPTIPPQL